MSISTLDKKITESSDVETLLSEHISRSVSKVSDPTYELSHALSRDGYLKITEFISEEVKELIRSEAFTLLGKMAKRRDISIPSTGYSPRSLSNVRQEDIAQHGVVIPSVYHSESFMRFIGMLACEEIIPNPWEYEKFIINRLERSGDTHGWHWGDYPYSVIWVLEAPSIDYGGLLQCIPHTYWNKESPKVEEYISKNPIRSYYHASGDVYLLKSDTTLHRVTPLQKDATRVIINMAWERARDKDRKVTHETFAFRD
ncbi:MAG: ArpA protein [Phormidesmis sp. RL_2_1]|nr:ArpA protein [Phormidesmis sp. RL_2_1]